MSKIGIDIIGFPCGKLGVGEQGRALARVALAAGYQINFIDCYHQTDSFINDEEEFKPYIGNKFIHPLRIYSITQPHIGALIYRYGTGYFDNLLNIFHLAWEFAKRPTCLDAGLHFSDEIWGISTFTSGCFADCFDISVQTMPNAVTLPEVGNESRIDFNLPKDSFIFYTSFDCNSTLNRKNPCACIKSFKKAFPVDNNVGLLLKVSNVNEKLPIWKELMDLIDEDKRIFVFDEVFSRKKLTALFKCCDAFISLHRSEGFGLCIAEAMLLKKPVVCTAYSGNMDFCSAETCFLVDFELVPVGTDQYFYVNQFLWAEPSTESAASKMLEVYAGGSRVTQTIDAACDRVVNNFSVDALSARFDLLVSNFLTRKNIRGNY